MPEYVWELPSSSTSIEDTAETGEGTIDHAEAAVDRLPQQFRKPKIEKILRIFCKPMAALEQAFIDLLTKRTVETAEGEQLNVLGRIVGQPQVDVTETTYRSIIRARIVANKSSGLGNQILRISRAVLSDYATQADVAAAGTMQIQLTPYYPAAFAVHVNGVDLPWDLANLLAESFLKFAAATGVRPYLEFIPQIDPDLVAYDDAFSLSTHGDETVGEEGYSSTTDLTVGGYLAAVIA
jgi:hypothetical protein